MNPRTATSSTVPVTVAAFLGCSLSAIPPLSIGALIHPLQSAFGWARAEITAAILISTIVGLVAFPIVGALVDRHGARRIALIGTAMQAVGIAGIGLAGPSVWSWYLAWLGFALLCGAASPLVWTAAVAKTVPENRRSLALAMALAGSSAMAVITPVLTLTIEQHFGWRAVYFLFAAYPLVIILPVAWLCLPRNTPHSGPKSAVGEAERQAGFGDLLRSPLLYPPLFAIFLNAAAVGMLMLHFVPMLARFSLPASSIALLAGLFGPFALAGRLGIGALLGTRLPSNRVFAVLTLGNAVAAWCLIFAPPSLAVGAVGIILTGFSQGAALVLVPFFAGRVFPIAVFGKANSLLISAYAIGFGIGPVLAGALFDHIGSYAPVGWLVAATVATAFTCALMIGGRKAGARPKPA